ncbi:MAG: DUF4157 domain-containing protein [Bacteroidia bacterium]|nr:DUF4157 domain-containing protein [Bacteroidia bacterium]
MKGEASTASSQLESQINSSKGGGSPLDAQTQSFMSDRFGADFSGVRIHTSSESVQMNQALGARAFTVGNDVHFNQGQYNPGSTEGKKLLAHELVHTVQQRSSTIRRQSSSSSSSGEGGEPSAPPPTGGLPASPANCKVDVRATHLGGILGSLPIYHLFIVYTDETNTESYFRGGPGGSCPGVAAGSYGTIMTTHGAYVPGTVDWDPRAPSVTVASGAAACGKDRCFTTELARIDATCTPYAPTGPNSNTVVGTLLTNCGLPKRKPVTIAPGFNHRPL